MNDEQKLAAWKRSLKRDEAPAPDTHEAKVAAAWKRALSNANPFADHPADKH